MVSCNKDVMPFVAMVKVECSNAGLNVIFKSAAMKGMSFYVFIVYTYVVATLLLPCLFIFNRNLELPPNKLFLLSRICLLRLIGFVAQVCANTGILYSSPTLASAIRNLVPAFTFLLAIIFRMGKLAWRSNSTKAKIIGTALSITGACVVTLYNGLPVMLPHPLGSFSNSGHQNTLKLRVLSKWVVRGFFLAVAYLLLPITYIIQGFFGSSMCTLIHTWGLRIKGPVYIAMFRPLSIAIATVMSFIFLDETLHLKSFVGAIVISVGFYAVLWGKAKEESI